MRLKAPFQEKDIITPSWIEKIIGHDRMQFLQQINPLVIRDPELEDKPKYFMADFRKDRISMFLNHQDKEKFFEDADRAYIAREICSSARFGDGLQQVGLEKLIHDDVYLAGYFPHDGSVLPEPAGGSVLPEAAGEPVLPEAAGEVYTNDRQRLRRDWARFGRVFKFQPYEAIKDYFGSEIAFYFAWLGFYTAWLVPLAIVGLAVFFYGIGSAGSHIPVQDVCDEKNHGVWYMCPLCDKHCSYWDFDHMCLCLRHTFLRQ